MATQITVNQHYVPQFLLNGFSLNEKKKNRIHIFDTQNKAFRTNQSIKDAFSQNYFYDKDNAVENLLSATIEYPASITINKLRNRDFSCLSSIDERVNLLQFISCQTARTVKSRSNLIELINAYFQQKTNDIARTENWNCHDVRNLKITPLDKDSTRSLTAHQALQGVIFSDLIDDLNIGVLINKTPQKFFISDHPISKYNWLYKEQVHHNVGSLLARGVTITLPISENICLFVYDKFSYKVGEKRSNAIIECINISDIQLINEFQMRNCHSFVGFSDETMQAQIVEAYHKFYGKNIYTPISNNLSTYQPSEAQFEYDNLIFIKQTKLSNQFSFLKTLRKASKLRSVFEIRSNELLERFELKKSALRELMLNRQ